MTRGRDRGRDHGRPRTGAARTARSAGERRSEPHRTRLARIVTPGRAGGLLGMIAAAYLWSLASGPSAFSIARLDVPELQWTEPAAVSAALADVAGANALQLETGPLEGSLAELPTVRSAEVVVSVLDGTLLVRIEERQPILGWRVGEAVFLVDPDGVILGSRDADAAGPTLPTIEDRRTGAADGLGIGARLDPTDLDVATRLGGLSPADVGSAQPTLSVVVTDRDGYIVRTAGWDAVFGFYGPATRSPEMIAGQVRLLRSLLADREGDVERVVLASDTNGTYVPRTSPRPSRG
jgi:hypothetical protein